MYDTVIPNASCSMKGAEVQCKSSECIVFHLRRSEGVKNRAVISTLDILHTDYIVSQMQVDVD